MIQAQAVLGQILEPFAHAEAILLDGFKSRVRTDVVDSATFIPATSTNFGLAPERQPESSFLVEDATKSLSLLVSLLSRTGPPETVIVGVANNNVTVTSP
ncbi:hypothetical protein MferCBS31731_004790 [Microsporum ferrugineum]